MCPGAAPGEPRRDAQIQAEGEGLAHQVVAVAVGGLQQCGVAGEGELDPILHLQPGVLAGVLDGVDDLAGVTLAEQILVDREIEGDGVGPLALDAVPVRRAHRQDHVLGAEGVLPLPTAIPIEPPSRSTLATCAGSSAEIASAASGMSLPNRGPRLR